MVPRNRILNLSDLLDKRLNYRSHPFFPPVHAFIFVPMLVDFHRILLTHVVARSATQFVSKKKNLGASMRSVRLEPARK